MKNWGISGVPEKVLRALCEMGTWKHFIYGSTGEKRRKKKSKTQKIKPFQLWCLNLWIFAIHGIAPSALSPPSAEGTKPLRVHWKMVKERGNKDSAP